MLLGFTLVCVYLMTLLVAQTIHLLMIGRLMNNELEMIWK
jgi:hypothetical protein